MFFSLKNSPTTFQTMINDIFNNLIIDDMVVVYLDDILIFTKTREENHHITRLVLDHLHQHKLYLHVDKCKFEWMEIKYLEMVIHKTKFRWI